MESTLFILSKIENQNNDDIKHDIDNNTDDNDINEEKSD